MARYLLLSFLLLMVQFVEAQKLLSEGSIQYTISLKEDSKDTVLASYFKGALSVVYLRGSQSRTDIKTALGVTTSIFNSKTNEGVILREFQSQKLLIRMNAANWAEKNKKFVGIVFEPTGEKKVINGYACEKAIAQLKDSTSFSVFYTKELATENKTYDPQFTGLSGFPVQYESVMGDFTIQFTLSAVSFDPVPIQRFAVPLKGYREISFDESLESARGKQQKN
jgi:hypothetical protein